MTATAIAVEPRCVVHVPALLVSYLHDAGRLPAVPAPPMSGLRGCREPTQADMRAVSWAVEYVGPVRDDGFRDVAGVVAFRDEYDFHTASDVRNVVYLAGSPRACITLLRCLQTEVGRSRRMMGSFDTEHAMLNRLVRRLGGTFTRAVADDRYAL